MGDRTKYRPRASHRSPERGEREKLPRRSISSSNDFFAPKVHRNAARCEERNRKPQKTRRRSHSSDSSFDGPARRKPERKLKERGSLESRGNVVENADSRREICSPNKRKTKMSERSETALTGKKKKKSRRRSSSSSSSSSDSSSSSSSSESSSSSSSSSSDERKRRKRRKKKKLAKKMKREERRRKEEKRKLKELKEKPVILVEKEPKVSKASQDRLLNDISVELAEKAKAMAPMTKEQWEKKQSVIRRVYDEETGRHRLIRGDGEILEEIVSRDRHMAINKQSTKGDGEYFQSKMRLNK